MVNKTKSPAQRCSADGAGKSACLAAMHAFDDTRTLPPRQRPALEDRCAQLASLTLMLYGRGREAFNDLFEHDRDNILWLVNDLASEVRDMVDGGER